MKLIVEKLPSGKVCVELTMSGDKKPVIVELDIWQQQGLWALLESVRRTNDFRFVLEL